MSQENVDVVQRAISAYNRRDVEAMRALGAPDIQLDWSASRGLDAGIYQGREANIAFYENFFDTFEQFVIEPEQFIEVGDCVVVPNASRVRGRDGVETVARSAFLFEVRSGSIIRIHLYQELREALEAAGEPS